MKINQAQIKEAASALRAGRLAVIPTDTIYGLAAAARDRQAVARLYRAKGRAPEKPFIILISRLAELAEFGIKLTPAQRRRLGEFWPGPVSIILPLPNEARRHRRLAYLHRGTRALAFRLPRPRSLRALLREVGPLAAPSANPEGQAPAATIAAARAYFGRRAAVYLDGGPLVSPPSTLIQLVPDGTVTLLRQGATKIRSSKVQ